MNPRPRAITVISILLILFALLHISVMVSAQAVAIDFASRHPGFVLLSFTTALIQLIVGVGIFMGKNWARYVFLRILPMYILFGIGIGLFLEEMGIGIYFKITFYLLFTGYLSQPQSYAYFNKSTLTRTGHKMGLRKKQIL